MPRFVSNRDTRFFYNINNEFINDVVETEVAIFKVVLEDSLNDEVSELYGESTTKKYYSGVRINALIRREVPGVSEDTRGQIISQDLKVAINREMAKNKNIYPEIGDIVEWNSYFYEVSNSTENQRLAGRSDEDYNWSFVLDCHLTNVGNMNLVERNK